MSGIRRYRSGRGERVEGCPLARRFWPWFVLLAFLVFVAVAVPGETGAASAPQTVKIRYTLSISYTAWVTAKTKLPSDAVVSKTERVSTWKARSLVPFTIERRGSRSRPQYRFNTKVAGQVAHRGSGKSRYHAVMSTGSIGPCWETFLDTGAFGNTQVRANVYAIPGKKLEVRFSGYDLRRPRPRVNTTYSGTECPLVIDGRPHGVLPKPRKVERCPGQDCPILPDPWKQTYSTKDFKFGRAFTLKRFEDPTSNPDLLKSLVQGTQTQDARLGTVPAGTLSETEFAYKYVLTFRPARGS